MTDSDLNEAVARKLGWAQCKGKGLPGWHSEERCAKDCNKTFYPFHQSLPDYCHSIAAAWEIVESIKLPLTVDLYSRREGVKWCFRVWRDEQLTAWLTEADADTAPMAICLAFLKLP